MTIGNCIGSVMVRVLASSAIDCGYESRSGQTKEVKYTTLRKQLNIPEAFRFKQLDYNLEYKTNIKAKIVDFYKLEDWF
jgi:hypothetical protein